MFAARRTCRELTALLRLFSGCKYAGTSLGRELTAGFGGFAGFGTSFAGFGNGFGTGFDGFGTRFAGFGGFGAELGT